MDGKGTHLTLSERQIIETGISPDFRTSFSII